MDPSRAPLSTGSEHGPVSSLSSFLLSFNSFTLVGLVLTTTIFAAMAGSSLIDGNDNVFNYVVLGITLGSIFGFMILIFAFVLCIRWACRRRERQKGGFDSEASASSTTIPMGKVTSPQAQIANNSTRNQSSASKRTGKPSISKPIPLIEPNPFAQSPSSPVPQPGVALTNNSPRPLRPIPPSSVASPRESVRNFARPQRPPVVGSTPVHLPANNQSAPNGGGSVRRSSGWNRYWSGGSALNMMGFGGNKRATQDSRQSDPESVYSQDTNYQRRTIEDPSFAPPPLYLGNNSRASMGQVSSGSPRIAHGPQGRGFPFQQGHVARTGSVSSVSSYGDSREESSSGVPTSECEGQQAWTPFGGSNWNNRAPSSVYTTSEYGQCAQLPQRTYLGENPHYQNRFQKPVPRNQRYGPQPQSSDISWLNLNR